MFSGSLQVAHHAHVVGTEIELADVVAPDDEGLWTVWVAVCSKRGFRQCSFEISGFLVFNRTPHRGLGWFNRERGGAQLPTPKSG
jgi:hypothetical protein